MYIFSNKTYFLILISLYISMHVKSEVLFPVPVTVAGFTCSAALLKDTTTLPKNKQPPNDKFIYAQFVFHTSTKVPDGERWINSYNVSSETWDLIKKCKTDIEALDVMGNLGWELICVTIREYKDYAYTVNTNYYFKKRIGLINK